MIRRPPRSTLDRSSAASDVYKRQAQTDRVEGDRSPVVHVLKPGSERREGELKGLAEQDVPLARRNDSGRGADLDPQPQLSLDAPGRVVPEPLAQQELHPCLLYTSDAADERSSVDLGGRRYITKKKIKKKKQK